LKPRPCLESAHKRNDAGEEDDSVYQTAAEPDSDQSEDSYSDFTPDDSFGSIRVKPSTRHAKDNEESQGSKPGKRGEVPLSTKPSENSSRSKKNGTVDADLADTFSKLRLQMLDFSDDEPQPTRGKRPTTPPPSEKSSQPKGLVSPKKAAFIPMTPHKSSSDAFWSQDLVDDWNDKHSPRKPIFAPKASSPVKSSPSKESKKLFAEKRQAIAESFLRELDDEITQGRIRELALSTGGIRLVWSKTLNTTAGRANWKRETVRTKQGSAQDAKITEAAPRHHAWIELAEKVIDDEDRLLNTLAHEFCHLATFMIDGITTNPHGQHFKAWAAKCSRAFGRRGVEVTTKHSYAIDFKYIWQCGACLAEYKRHSRSIDPVRHRCGSCKGVLAQIKPAPRKNNAGSGGGAKLSEYQIFMKDEMKIVRGENPGSPQKEVMLIVAERWAKKNGKDKPKSKGVAGVDGVVDKLEILTVEDDD
jgi:predicted SprT family Zn-dependent metalloprotease